MAHLYAHASGADAVGFWFTAPSSGTAQIPLTGDTLDVNGKAVTANCTVYIGATTNLNLTICDTAGGGSLTVTHNADGTGTITFGDGVNSLTANWNNGSTVATHNPIVVNNLATLDGSNPDYYAPITVNAGGTMKVHAAGEPHTTIALYGTFSFYNTGEMAGDASITVYSGGVLNVGLVGDTGQTDITGGVVVCQSGGTINLFSDQNTISENNVQWLIDLAGTLTCNFTLFSGNMVIRNGGVATFEVGGVIQGNIDVTSGGTLIVNNTDNSACGIGTGSTTYGNVSVETGGVFNWVVSPWAAQNNGNIIVYAGGTMTTDGAVITPTTVLAYKGANVDAAFQATAAKGGSSSFTLFGSSVGPLAVNSKAVGALGIDAGHIGPFAITG